MANVKFGFAHLSAPTPASITRAVTILSVVIPVFLAWISSDNNLFGVHTSHVINSIGVLFIALINVVKPFFGVDISSPSVPTKDVTAIKTN